MNTKTKIFLTLFLTYAFFTNTYLTTNDASRFSLTSAIAEDQTLVISGVLEEVISDWWIPKDFAVYEGEIYSDKAPLGSFLGVPIYLGVRFFSTDTAVLTYFVSLFTSGLLTAATALLIYDIGRHFTEKEYVKIVLALTFGLGTMAFIYATVFFSHAITSFFGFASFYLLFQLKGDNGATKNMALSGVASALAISSDYYMGLIAGALFIYAIFKNWRKAYAFILPFLATISLLLIYHWAAFDNPFTTPYLYSNLYVKFHSTGFYGIRIPDSALIINLFSMLFSKWGFFFTNPIILVSLVAFPRFWKKYRLETYLIIFISAGLFYIEGSIGRLDAYSARFLVPLLPFLFLPLYLLNYNKWETKFMLLLTVVISTIINLVGVDIFLPESDIPVIIATIGNHNILGEFLLSRGINLHYLTILPLLFFCAFIWRNEIMHGVKGRLSRAV